MTEQLVSGSGERPLWRRIVDFPLVAMLIGMVVFVIGLAVSGILAKFVVPSKAAKPKKSGD